MKRICLITIKSNFSYFNLFHMRSSVPAIWIFSMTVSSVSCNTDLVAKLDYMSTFRQSVYFFEKPKIFCFNKKRWSLICFCVSLLRKITFSFKLPSWVLLASNELLQPCRTKSNSQSTVSVTCLKFLSYLLLSIRYH